MLRIIKINLFGIVEVACGLAVVGSGIVEVACGLAVVGSVMISYFNYKRFG